MSKEIEEDDRVPRRKLNKQEAIRHLLHTSVRLIMKMEDRFAIHLLVHSADKMLIDIAKKRGKLLRMDWEDYIKPEYHSSFFKRYWKTYNYFKHANDDFSEDLPVHDIAMMNVMQLFMSVTNYRTIFEETTDHFTLFAVFIFNLMPQIIIPHDDVGRQILKNVKIGETMTPKRFFELFESNSSALPKFWLEASQDMEDVIDFYHLSFVELRMGEKKSRPSVANTRPSHKATTSLTC
jgi:hypothetical protein